MERRGFFTRRAAILTGLGAASGVALARAWPGEAPPTHGNLLRAGDSLTYAAQRALLPSSSLAREYARKDVTSMPATGTFDPSTGKAAPELAKAYARLKDGAFADFRLPIEGAVARPRAFSVSELKQFAPRTQVTRHTCEEGWTAIAEWTGVPLRLVLEAAGILPAARFVVFESFDDWVDSIDMADALHPQTLLAYGMNGRDLAIPHGAPVRLRVERQLGYKSMKYLKRIVVTDRFEDGGKKGNIQNGWAWYTGI
jgi:DMSO/TMAO reductase YedYZ molybdopterin-dependent catalytic subunit